MTMSDSQHFCKSIDDYCESLAYGMSYAHFICISQLMDLDWNLV